MKCADGTVAARPLVDPARKLLPSLPYQLREPCWTSGFIPVRADGARVMYLPGYAPCSAEIA